MKKWFYFIPLLLFVACNQAAEKNNAQAMDEKEFLLFVGTYTDKEGHVDGQADGIYALKFNPSTGKLTNTGLEVQTTNPSYLAVDAENNRLYAVNEKVGVGEMVSAFEYSEDTIRILNALPSQGGAPCHLLQKDKYLITANYVGGNHVVYQLNEEGGLGSITDQYQYQGSGLTRRQEASHAHMITENPHTGELLGVDLGTDIITYFKLNSDLGKLEKVGEIILKPGSGPRHVDFHPTIDVTYVLNELNGTVEVIRKIGGQYAVSQTLNSTESANIEEAGCAAIKIHPSHKFLMVSNRGPFNTITQFMIQEDGSLIFDREFPSGGDVPRDFAFGPSGKYLLSAHQNSNDIAVFAFDEHTGESSLVQTFACPTPVCLKFE